ncbi:16S rRNA (adenine1518-N6/adenine1519-N6)-dimethyltransferase [Andreprevotia lacus DSM 23236]|jgi:16S rRNA (adenine1518-N6/adenine1519-N6)-dimethyltransferase|uniref:Ribosomal RNA small subunit methyltransferase A n=1 Tax=Andreprevotia lacus DSM 23236 TaxID=1121001 RepID=A0A1W1Y073_9NEIS|nr:16S rRNA (adenine(1518)-N(6)/adenine(1519)-N(6))-dimethyltransferase RsmA [Andreprevotia lacus]SMC29566.1 16S rRNA (adenine1518-N6/adenine1519-N6)-dimethyltransferase [Andreprevotia lacus DSM 23236]
MSSHIPRKRFGQNFLQDQGVIGAIIAAINPQHGDVLVEIGPGLAALTDPLMRAAGKLHVVEIDRDIVSHLSGKYPPEQLVIHHCDALKFDFGALAREIGHNGVIRLAGNLPYNISTPLLFHLASFGSTISDMHFMLQKEVVDRMVAEPSTADYGRLSVMLQVRFNMEHVLDVPPTAFYPPPKVDSAVVRMMPWPAPPWPANDLVHMEKLVTTAFAQRRKTLRNNLKGIVSDDELLALGIDPGCRAENVTVQQYVALSNFLHAQQR